MLCGNITQYLEWVLKYNHTTHVSINFLDFYLSFFINIYSEIYHFTGTKCWQKVATCLCTECISDMVNCSWYVSYLGWIIGCSYYIIKHCSSKTGLNACTWCPPMLACAVGTGLSLTTLSAWMEFSAERISLLSKNPV